MPPFLDHDPPIAFAHRGGGLDRPENTMAAIDHAVGMGYRFIETDVCTTSDGVAVLLHDPPPDTAEGLAGRIDAMPWSQARHVRIESEPLARLDDALGVFPDARLNLDVKTDAAVDAVIEVLRRLDATARVCAGSFSDRRLRRLRTVFGGQLTTSTGPREVQRLRAAAWRVFPRRAASTPARAAQVPATYKHIRVVDRRFVQTAHALDLQVHVWTVNDEAEMTRLLDLGVDGLMTDRLSLLRDVLSRRKQWPTA